jgi:3-oxoacyl-[acyl-carrier-protein] synthase III
MVKSIIKGIGKYISEQIVTNDDLTKMFDTSDEWIFKNTGIKERRWVPKDSGLKCSDLSLFATRKALDDARWVPEDLDLIIFATGHPDIFLPGSGPILAHKLGLKDTPAIDIRQQCTGFIYAMSMADMAIRSGKYNKILVACSDLSSNTLDLTDKGRLMSVLFGDGAGSVLLEGVESDKEIGLLDFDLHSSGEHYKAIKIDMHPSYPPEHYAADEHRPMMEGPLVFKEAMIGLEQTINKTLSNCNLSLADIDIFVPHQANQNMNNRIAEIMNIPMEKVFCNIKYYGNLNVAAMPVALDEAMIKFPKAKYIMVMGFGAGLTWGSFIYRTNV